MKIGEYIFEATPATANVPSLLSGGFTLAGPITVNPGSTLTLKLENDYSDTGAGSAIYYDSTQACPGAAAGPCDSTITFNAPAPPPPPPPPGQATGIAPRFQVHVAPPELGNDAGEPSVGANWFTGKAMFISSIQALRLEFQENANPAMPVACDALWLDKSGTLTTANTLDPILFTDEKTGRTFNSQLSGANSLFEFTDDDGDTWTPGQIGTPNGGADHQTVASGAFPSDHVPATASWPAAGDKRAVYYCSQSVGGAFCARSDDGGQTFGPGFPFKNPDCAAGALHGHVKVAPDGTVYVPDSSQCVLPVGGTAEKVVVFVSEDAGQTWNARPVPMSSGGGSSDPSLGIATDGTLYNCYENGDGRIRVAVSKDKGVTWINDTDISSIVGVRFGEFPQSIAGDPNRAGCAFLGTMHSVGDSESLDFEGVWFPYVAATYDGGVSWHVVNVSPDDPVQGRGGIGPDGTNRNLLDFNDLQLDEKGRLLFAYADGCTGACVTDPSKNSFTAKATLVRQTGGRTMFSAFDNAADTQFNATAPIKPAPACARADTSVRTASYAKVNWNAPDTGGTAITNYAVYRSDSATGPFTLVGDAGTATQTIDTSVDASVPTYYYRIVASNAQGAAAASNIIPLTVQPPPATADTCTIPGQIVAIDAVGDGTHDDTDIVSISVAEPEAYEGNFVITMKLKDFTADVPPPDSFYPILFPTEGPLYIALDNTQALTRYTYGTYTDVSNGVLAFTEAGTLEERSNFAPDGTVQLVVPKNLFADTEPGAIISGFDARSRIGAPSVPSRDTAGPGDYRVRGTGICRVPEVLLAALEASTQSGGAPLEVTFTVSGTPPTGRTLQTYSLNLGDGTVLSNQPFGGQPSVQVTHTYQNVGTYRARLVVTDSDGNVSDNPAQRTVDAVSAAGCVRFAGAIETVDEDEGLVLVTVERAGGSFGSITVDYAADGGTATEGSDFAFASAQRTLTFGNGETIKSFIVEVTDDSAIEADEVIELALINPGGTTVDVPSRAFVNIVNDDGAVPQALAVDGAMNGVLEAGEVAPFAPSWRNTGENAASISGALTFAGPGAASYTVTTPAAEYGTVAPDATSACATCYGLTVTGERPSQHWDATATETLSNGAVKEWTVHIGESFDDMPMTSPFYRHVEILFHNGITVGCGAGFCGTASVLRQQSAVFLSSLIASSPSDIPTSGSIDGQPFSCSSGGNSLFNDVAPESGFCKFVHYLYANKITAGCGNGNFCPTATTTRAQMAVFVSSSMTIKEGLGPVPSSYSDPNTSRSYNCTDGQANVFSDVSDTHFACKQIHYLWARGIAAGVDGGRFAPSNETLRQQMAAFLSAGFQLKLYKP